MDNNDTEAGGRPLTAHTTGDTETKHEILQS